MSKKQRLPKRGELVMTVDGTFGEVKGVTRINGCPNVSVLLDSGVPTSIAAMSLSWFKEARCWEQDHALSSV